ncbi:hypothetical protein NDU88_002338 [Pleurodeles waltl]|uniref:Uncharacterized protein n=1 Tax=Pleurodeles waltl TaxID=8319 RepID=A0AAV7T299_PLEWA|nr:hypothetical protein NDU88_002338 [Pleurodeles waltl]
MSFTRDLLHAIRGESQQIIVCHCDGVLTFPAHNSSLGQSDPYPGGTFEGFPDLHVKPDIRSRRFENPENTQGEGEDDSEWRVKRTPSLKIKDNEESGKTRGVWAAPLTGEENAEICGVPMPQLSGGESALDRGVPVPQLTGGESDVDRGVPAPQPTGGESAVDRGVPAPQQTEEESSDEVGEEKQPQRQVGGSSHNVVKMDNGCIWN